MCTEGALLGVHLPHTKCCWQGRDASLSSSSPAGTAGSASTLDKPRSAMMAIEVLGGPQLWPCFRARLGSVSLTPWKEIRLSDLLLLGGYLGSQGLKSVCVHV